MYLTERFTRKRPSEWQHNRRITQTHLFRLNGGVPTMSLESSFWRDLLYMAAWLQKKWGDIHYIDFYTRRNPTNDVGKCLCHLPNILYDAFYITAQQCRYVMYCRGNTGGNCITGGNGGHITKTDGLGYTYASAKRSATLDRGQIPLHI